ncbi:MAG: hypothetical protein GIW99_07345 [Candidatus Eremiobacteraeota bacterium]|nr:hypothetical protein [Candidatus Eremiobacteraeota bacterium]MBC5827478.1 hypothetical protein [Candidatus Eremiobacteraeota bacterium]
MIAGRSSRDRLPQRSAADYFPENLSLRSFRLPDDKSRHEEMAKFIHDLKTVRNAVRA